MGHLAGQSYVKLDSSLLASLMTMNIRVGKNVNNHRHLMLIWELLTFNCARTALQQMDYSYIRLLNMIVRTTVVVNVRVPDLVSLDLTLSYSIRWPYNISKQLYCVQP